MKDWLFDYFTGQASLLSFERILLNFCIATIIGLIIYISYKFSHSGVVYSARFNVSLVMLTIITTLVMVVIGNNVALSLGMVGALSIVRFRTAIKDPRDTAYIFWCIAVGICCGVSEFLIAAVGSGIIFLFLLLFGRIKKNDRFLLIIRSDLEQEEKISEKVKVTFGGQAKLKVKNSSKILVEMIYELSESTLQKTGQEETILNKFYEIEGVENVNLVCQNDEINR